MIINFYDSVDDSLMKFAVIVSRYNKKWVFCKHKERNTYEIPGGHREKDEAIIETAKRELYEETGAIEYKLSPVCVYSVVSSNQVSFSDSETFGMLFYADIEALGDLPSFEMEEVVLFDKIPEKLTYPLIQPHLIRKVESMSFFSAAI